MAAIIAGLGAQLGLDTTEFKKGIAEAKTSLKEFKESLPEFLSIAALAELTREAITYANTVVEAAKANEIATASVIALSKALDENGGEAESVGQIYGKFTQNLEKAISGNDQLQIAFSKLGVSLKDLASMTEEQLFDRVAMSLGNMKDAVERNGLAITVFGKAIRGVDLKGLVADLHETKGEYDKYAVAVEKAHELSKKLNNAHEELVLNWTNAVIPSLAALYESYNKTAGAMEKVMYIVKTISMVVVATFKEITTGISQVYDVLKALGSWAINFFTGNFKQAGQALIDGFKEVQKDGLDYIEFLKELIKVNNEVQQPKIKGPEGPVQRAVIDSLAKQKLEIAGISRLYKEQLEILKLQYQTKEQDKNLTVKEREVADAVAAVYTKMEEKLIEIDKLKQGIDRKHPRAGEMLKELENQAKAVREATREAANAIDDLIRKQQENQEQFEYGWNQAFNQFKENAMNAADAGKQSFNSIVSSMTSAIENFVKTGKLNFGDLAKSIIADLIRIQMQLQISQLFSKMNLGNLLPMLSGSVPTGTSLATDIPLPGRADGGDLNMNQMAIVGERGPELFIPKSAGTVIPNNQLQGAMGNTTVNNYNINAIDTKSFEDRIFQSSRAVWAAGQYANKSLAVQTGRM